MAELLNLRMARKRTKRRQDEAEADANRLVYGQSKNVKRLAAAREAKARRDLEQHRIKKGDSR
jgi:Domain of unknown function (DUF4169)